MSAKSFQKKHLFYILSSQHPIGHLIEIKFSMLHNIDAFVGCQPSDNNLLFNSYTSQLLHSAKMKLYSHSNEGP